LKSGERDELNGKKRNGGVVPNGGEKGRRRICVPYKEKKKTPYRGKKRKGCSSVQVRKKKRRKGERSTIVKPKKMERRRFEKKGDRMSSVNSRTKGRGPHLLEKKKCGTKKRGENFTVGHREKKEEKWGREARPLREGEKER